MVVAHIVNRGDCRTCPPATNMMAPEVATGMTHATVPTALDLASFEKPIALRQMAEGDFQRVIEMQQACFPGMKPWTKAQLASHLAHFPEGQLVVEVDGKVVGSASSLILDFDAYEENHSF